MNLTISGRHLEITDAIRNHVTTGLDRVKRHFDKVIDANVVLAIEKHRHRQIAEINLHANGLRINAKESSSDLYSSIDSALSKIERQVTRHKERIKRHQPRTNRETREFHHNVIEFGLAEEHHPAPHQIIYKEKVPLQTMTIEEAAFQLGLVEDDFIMFANADTHEINVVYDRGNGTFGVIEPLS
jgi:putative sigma-54 modulation protein